MKELFKSIEENNISSFLELMARLTVSGSGDCKDNENRTPSNYAAFFGRIDMVNAFIISNKLTWNSIHYACLGGQFELVKKILETKNLDFGKFNNGQKIDVCRDGHKTFSVAKDKRFQGVDSDNFDLFFYACQSGNLELIQYLHKQDRCRPNDINICLAELILKGHLQSFEWLFGKVSCANYSNRVDYSRDKKIPLLLVGVKADSLPMVECMTKSGSVDFNITDNKSNTALHVSAKYGKLEMIKYFLDKNASLKKHGSVNLKNNKGWSPLMVGSFYDKEDIVNELLSFGVQMPEDLGSNSSRANNSNNSGHFNNLENFKKQSCFEKYTNLFMDCRFLIRFANGSERLSVANQEKFNTVFKKLKHLTLRDEHGVTLLQLAILSGRVGAVETLVGNGFSIKAQDRQDKDALAYVADLGDAYAREKILCLLVLKFIEEVKVEKINEVNVVDVTNDIQNDSQDNEKDDSEDNEQDEESVSNNAGNKDNDIDENNEVDASSEKLIQAKKEIDALLDMVKQCEGVVDGNLKGKIYYNLGLKLLAFRDEYLIAFSESFEDFDFYEHIMAAFKNVPENSSDFRAANAELAETNMQRGPRLLNKSECDLNASGRLENCRETLRYYAKAGDFQVDGRLNVSSVRATMIKSVDVSNGAITEDLFDFDTVYNFMMRQRKQANLNSSASAMDSAKNRSEAMLSQFALNQTQSKPEQQLQEKKSGSTLTRSRSLPNLNREIN